TGVTERKESLALGDHTPALAVRADGGRGARCRTRAVTVGAGVGLVHRHAHRHTLERVGERQLDPRLDIAAALLSRARPARAAAVEQPTEQIAQIEVGTGTGEVKALRPALGAGAG